MRILLSCLLFISTLVSAKATDNLIRYEDFIHLPLSEQRKTAALIHDFLTEYNNQYLLDTLTKKQKLKYHSYLRILNFFVDSAYGSDPQLSDKIPGELKCYYGGWISFMKNGRCVHPKRITYGENQEYLEKMAGEYSLDVDELKRHYHLTAQKFIKLRYQKEFISLNIEKAQSGQALELEDKNICIGTSSTTDKESIVCNPEIYGSPKGKAICVQAGMNDGINISYLCQKTLEKIKENDAETYQQTLNDVINKALTTETPEFFGLMHTMYDSCLCGGDSGQATPEHFAGSINKEYAQKMFHSRACLGILNQTQTINEHFRAAVCKAPKDSELNVQDANTKKWFKFLNNVNKIMQDKKQKMRNVKIGSLRKLSFENRDSEKQAIIDNDMAAYGGIADENYKIAVNAKLCPVLSKASIADPVATTPPKKEEEKIPGIELNFDAETKILKMEIKGIEDKALNKYEISGPSVAEDIKVSTPELKEDNKLIKTYTVNQVDKAYRVTAKIKEKKGDKEASASTEIPANEKVDTPAEENMAKCKVSIGKEQNGDIFQLTAKVIAAKDGKKLALKPEEISKDMQVQWYDLTKAKPKASEKQGASSRVISGSEGDAQETEKDEPEQMAEKFKELSKAKNKLAIKLGQLFHGQRFGVSVTSNTGKSCRAIAIIDIPAKPKPRPIINNSPRRINPMIPRKNFNQMRLQLNQGVR